MSTQHPVPLTLTASVDTAPAPAAVELTAAVAERTISGIIVEYGAVGYASTGKTIFHEGSLSFPDDLARCKFLLMHDYDRPLGTMAAFTDDPAKPHGVFKVATGKLGDDSLAEAADGRRDGLSVGCLITRYDYDDDGVLHVHAAEVREVSLVTIPAFQNSMVSTVAASLKGSEIMSKPTLAPAPQALTASTPAADAAPQPPAAAAPAVPSAAAQQPATATAAVREPAPQAAPVLSSTAAAGADTLAEFTASYLASGAPARGLEAALTDQLLSDDGGSGHHNGAPGQYVGELWSASLIERPTIDSIQHKPLTGLKVYGFQRDYTGATRMINKYDFNKTEMPASGKYKTKPVEADAQGYAGGWDIDRRYIDLGDGSFIRSVYDAAVDDYKLETEEDAVAAMLAAATVVPGVATVPAALAQLGLQAAGLGASLSKIQFGANAWAEFLDMNGDDVPWWLQKMGTINLADTSGSAGNLGFNVNQNLDANAVLAHDKRAATWYEVNPPIKVQAVDIARGGIDLGVYGYGAIIINDARAIYTTTVTAPAGV